MDTNLVEVWLRRDPVRWIAGAMAGVFAGLMMMLTAMVIAAAAGAEIWLPIKLAASPVLGANALEYGANPGVFMAGLVVHLGLSMSLGILYAHFAATNMLTALLGAGLVWGIFGWIFINNLFTQSFATISAIAVPNGAALPPHLIWGLSLTSVVFFDRMLRGNRAAR